MNNNINKLSCYSQTLQRSNSNSKDTLVNIHSPHRVFSSIIVANKVIYSPSFLLRLKNYINEFLASKNYSPEIQTFNFIINLVASFAYPNCKIENTNESFTEIFITGEKRGILFASSPLDANNIGKYFNSTKATRKLIGFDDYWGQRKYNIEQIVFIVKQRCCFILDNLLSISVSSHKISQVEYDIENSRNILEKFLDFLLKVNESPVYGKIISKLKGQMFANATINLIYFFNGSKFVVEYNIDETKGILNFENDNVAHVTIKGTYYKEINVKNAELLNIKTSSLFGFFLSLKHNVKQRNRLLYPKLLACNLKIDFPIAVYNKLRDYLLREFDSREICGNQIPKNCYLNSLITTMSKLEEQDVEIQISLRGEGICKLNLFCPISMMIPSEQGDVCAIKYKNKIQLYSLEALKDTFIFEETEKVYNNGNGPIFAYGFKKDAFLVPLFQKEFSDPDITLLGMWWLMQNIKDPFSNEV